jgi:GNAT superfamily N-acetyltransferase
MKIMDLTEEHEDLYCVCLEDWSDEISEGKQHKEGWYKKMKDKGLRVKLAVDDNNHVGGMIQYVPIELSFIEGKDLYFVNCIWVHGYDKGRGNFQKKGMGQALLRAAEEDAKALGAKGLAAWGIPLPFWMKASWFKKHGYRKVDKQGFMDAVLLWKPFSEDAVPPKWIKQKKTPEKILGKVAVTYFINGWCTVQGMILERVKRAVSEFADTAVFQAIDTFNRETMLEWGITEGLFIDGKKIVTGPPPSYEKIKKKIEKRVKKVRGRKG